MELKRILARDTRSATDQAIALYGPDVLVISNHQVGGQTELVVAIEMGNPSAADAPALNEPEAASPAPITFTSTPPMVSVHAPAAAPTQDDDAFLRNLVQAQARPAAAPLPIPAVIALAAPSAEEPSTETKEALEATDARDYLRSREIVEMVRDEMAALRREFRLSQQTAGWQSGLNLPSGIAPLVQALGEAGVPNGLRTLLVDSLKDMDSAEGGIQALREQLSHTLKRRAATLPTKGVHALAGASGSGKTLMLARLARHGEQLHGADQVAVISYQDARAGAWSQWQMLGAQLGVECFRANDTETLATLLGELSQRRLVLIDTPGVRMKERLAEISSVHRTCVCHAVVAADASAVTLKRVLVDSGIAWKSLMLSKLDESDQPWALLQFLSDNPLSLAGASDGVRLTDLIQDFSIPQLIDLALAPLQASLPAAAPAPEAVVVPDLSTVQVLKQRKTATRKKAA